MGTYESYLAVEIARLIGNFVVERQLGIVFGADGMMRLCPGLVRIPDVSFISWRQLPDHKVPRTAMVNVAPDLAVEVISKGNTPREMDRKLADYFSAGVRLAWYVYPDKREVHVYRSPENPLVLREGQAIEGGDVLPGFSVSVKALFPE
jgi:Uma2 family endonuclease